MKQNDFERRVLHLWMTTRVPLSRPNLLFLTGVPRAKLDRWLDELVREGVLDVDSDDAGELIWTVRGAARPTTGLERVEEVARMEKLSSSVSLARREPSALSGGSGTVRAAGDFVGNAIARRGGEKSPVVAGALSLLGPIGWLYAAPAKEAVPAAIAWYLAFAFLPWWLVLPIRGALIALSVVVGVLYSFAYNKNGQVTPLFTDDGPPRLPGRR